MAAPVTWCCGPSSTRSTPIIDVIRGPVPPWDGRFLHQDFQPGNVLFEMARPGPSGPRITGVVDWAGCSWSPADLDVAHCSTVLAMLHGPARVVEERLDAHVTGVMNTLG